MTAPVDIPALLKASEVVVSLFKKVSDYAPFVISLHYCPVETKNDLN